MDQGPAHTHIRTEEKKHLELCHNTCIFRAGGRFKIGHKPDLIGPDTDKEEIKGDCHWRELDNGYQTVDKSRT